MIVGGGFYGALIAEHYAKRGLRTVILDRQPELMMGASYKNQARVHGGYHYPRSFSTAQRSQHFLDRFVREFAPAVRADFDAIYAIAKTGSKIGARSFAQTMSAIGASLKPLPPETRKIFRKGAVEESFLVREPVFDSACIRKMMLDRLARAGVEVRLNTPVSSVAQGLAVRCSDGTLHAERVYLCTYDGVNVILKNSGLAPLRLQNEWTEICLVEMPESLRDLGVTVMDGAFFSFLPFPSRGCHSLTHVTYTPHQRWLGDAEPPLERRTAFSLMIKDSARLVPELARARYVDSLWQTKTVLPRNEANDGRPIFFSRDYQLPGLNIVLGSKIDSAYDIVDEIEAGPSWSTL